MRMEQKERNYTPWVIFLSVAINVIVAILFFMPKVESGKGMDLTFLPMLNAILNSFTFIFLLAAFYFIRNKNIKMHRNFIFSAFITTGLFLITYVTYHFLAESTPYGGTGFLRGLYYFFLLTHILLAVVIVPLALTTLARGLNRDDSRHRRIARWTMPLWLYVAASGVIVYLMISPYYA